MASVWVGCAVPFASQKAVDAEALVDGDAGEGGVADATAQDGAVSADAQIAADACVAPTDQELCALQGQQCDALFTLDHCGNMRNIAECGPCPADHFCQNQACIACGTCKTCTVSECYRDIFHWSDSQCTVPCCSCQPCYFGPAATTNADGSFFCAPNGSWSPFWNGGPCNWVDTVYTNNCAKCGSYSCP